MNKHCFHINGGAAVRGGRTLTAHSPARHKATREANQHFGPELAEGRGEWVQRRHATGPDSMGNCYIHYDWRATE